MTADVHFLPDETKTSVAAVCRVHGVPRSTVYSRRNRKPSQRAKKTAALDVATRAAHAENKVRYGTPPKSQRTTPKWPAYRAQTSREMHAGVGTSRTTTEAISENHLNYWIYPIASCKLYSLNSVACLTSVESCATGSEIATWSLALATHSRLKSFSIPGNSSCASDVSWCRRPPRD